MESAAEYLTARALLDWQVEMGVDEAMGNAPIDRYALESKVITPKVVAEVEAPPAPAEDIAVDAVAVAKSAALAAQDLDGLRAAMGAFEHCALKTGARNLIFSDGVAGSAVMIISDAPDREDDRAATLFAGPAGILLDKMLAAIGLARSGDTAVCAAPVLPWNPPQNREPNADEIAMMLPFLLRHIELAAPKILILMGNGPCQALLKKTGMTRLRGGWTEAAGLPALPMFAPSYLLNTPAAKRDTWADLLALKDRLRAIT